MSKDFNPLDKNGLRDVKAEREREERQRIADLQLLMREPWGRRIMARLLDASGVERTTFTGNSDGFRLEGRRQIGLEFLRDVKHYAFENYVLMLKEQKTHE